MIAIMSLKKRGGVRNAQGRPQILVGFCPHHTAHTGQPSAPTPSVYSSHSGGTTCPPQVFCASAFQIEFGLVSLKFLSLTQRMMFIQHPLCSKSFAQIISFNAHNSIKCEMHTLSVPSLQLKKLSHSKAAVLHPAGRGAEIQTQAIWLQSPGS